MTDRTHAPASVVARFILSAGAALLVSVTAVMANEPKVPPAPAPDGIPVAILGPGVDYRVPAVRDRLARDGEGDLISWDFVDGDIRPFEDALAGRGTPYALAVLSANAAATLVFVRERLGDPQAFGHMMSFVAKTPARIVMWPDARPTRPDWPILIEAARRFQQHLFIIPREVGAAPAPFTPLVPLANIIFVDVQPPVPPTATRPALALSAAAARAAQLLAQGTARPIAEIAAAIRKEMAAEPNAWRPAVVPNRP